jgi:hypothetical protein
MVCDALRTVKAPQNKRMKLTMRRVIRGSCPTLGVFLNLRLAA